MAEQKFVNVNDRFGDQYEVTIDEYREMFPECKFEVNGDEIRYRISDEPGDYEVAARKQE